MPALRRSPRGAHPPAPPRPAGPCAGEIEAEDGLPSADRNNKATLLLTGPFRTAKSSAEDLTPLVLRLQYANRRGALPAPRGDRLLGRQAEAYPCPSVRAGGVAAFWHGF